jgi:hypothetical protein
MTEAKSKSRPFKNPHSSRKTRGWNETPGGWNWAPSRAFPRFKTDLQTIAYLARICKTKASLTRGSADSILVVNWGVILAATPRDLGAVFVGRIGVRVRVAPRGPARDRI